MFDGDGAETLELQAYKLVQNAGKRTNRCAQCELIMNPVEYMYSINGLCAPCNEKRRQKRIKTKMVH